MNNGEGDKVCGLETPERLRVEWMLLRDTTMSLLGLLRQWIMERVWRIC